MTANDDWRALLRLEHRADEYGLYAHHSTDATLRWLQAIRQAAELRTRLSSEAWDRHLAAIRKQRITASQADDMFYRLSSNPYRLAA